MDTQCQVDSDVDHLDDRFAVNIESLILTYELIIEEGNFNEELIRAEQARVSLICYTLGYQYVGLKQLNYLLDLPNLFTLAAKEPNIQHSMDNLGGSYREPTKNKYLVACEQELQVLNIEFMAMARFTAAAWMHLAFCTHFNDGISLGWVTLDTLFASEGLGETHPDSWTLDNFQ
ncbi:hypothetical protein F7Q91_03190 [Vibrio chagasii]|uniref:Uncharacterized protein n=1 Tax=Vibrio chagasii TaxID=170679 RepID=A0A7V7NX31_9VIBR|nr:hypothetical protein [Vibrio chagasii]KAB0482427.1 hypothetical protein F7Q91_03190 [Vibrio chagasii]